MECPRCSKPLVKETVDSEEIDVCKSCGGMWLHKNQLNSLISESIGDVEMSSIDQNEHEDKYPEIKCRNCHDVTMHKVNFLDYSDIIMDYCPRCGSFWLDRDELAGMHAYIEKVEEGSHDVRYNSAYNILVRLSQIAYSIFH